MTVDDGADAKPEDLRGLPFLGRRPHEILQGREKGLDATCGDLREATLEDLMALGLPEEKARPLVRPVEYEIQESDYWVYYGSAKDDQFILTTLGEQGFIHFTGLDAQPGAFVVEGLWDGTRIVGRQGRGLYLVSGLIGAIHLASALFWRFVGQRRLDKAHSPVWAHLQSCRAEPSRQKPDGTVWSDDEGSTAWLVLMGEFLMNGYRDRTILRRNGAKGSALEAERISMAMEALGVFDELCRVERIEEYLARPESQEELKATLARDSRRRPRIPPTRPLRLPVDARIVARAFNILNREGITDDRSSP